MNEIIINDVELLLDVSDADVLEALAKGIPACIDKCNKIKDKRISETQKIKEMCLVIRDIFDNIFGEGTSLKIVDRPNSLDKWVSAWQSFMTQLRSVYKELHADRNGLLTTNGDMRPARGSISLFCCGGFQRACPLWHTTLRSKV